MTDNPAWKPLLDKLPESLHPLITPILTEWDASAQQKIQAVQSQYEGYEGYKPFIDAKLDPELVQQSLMLFDQFRTNPQKVIKEAIDAYELPYVDSTSIQQDDPLENEDSDMSDITKNPQFQQLAKTIEELNNRDQSREQERLQSQAEQEHREWLAEMQKPENSGPFNEMYVTALMSQGMSGEDAIKSYQAEIAKSIPITTDTQQVQTPTVMGGSGTTGSGLPESPINFGDMKTNDVNKLVDEMLQAAAAQNNQG